MRICTYINAGIRILEGLSATGLRAIRYAKEIEGLDKVVANDFSKSAVEVRINTHASISNGLAHTCIHTQTHTYIRT
jgi:tRNA (guanine26-N2/guanine27-N2)-dimethyltransferase